MTPKFPEVLIIDECVYELCEFMCEARLSGDRAQRSFERGLQFQAEHRKREGNNGDSFFYLLWQESLRHFRGDWRTLDEPLSHLVTYVNDNSVFQFRVCAKYRKLL